ncbi:MAG TPA: DUF1003 domain-containing protein [Ktedonobacterales bacterium]|nr:DUF1003 domain-containing protein [Ktedonobacterales bacterium]
MFSTERSGASLLLASGAPESNMETTGNLEKKLAAMGHQLEQDYLHIPEHLRHLHFPSFKHAPSQVIDVNKVADERLTMGDRIADAVAATVGSWRFIIIQSIVLAFWLVANSIAWAFAWDPRPFILLNLVLSFQAAYSAPFVMMSQNRQAEKDRLTAQNDYLTDTKGEEEIRHILAHLEHQDALIIKIIERLETQHDDILNRIAQLNGAVQPAGETLPAPADQNKDTSK